MIRVDLREVEKKWRKIWEEAKVFEADPDLSKPKFFITTAFPYVNSPQHIGHARTYSITDALARFMRMKGYRVLLPMAWHLTGTPIIAMVKRLASGDRELYEDFVKVYKVPPEVVETFKDPLTIAHYFEDEIKAGMKEMGYSIDWRREFTTIDPGFNNFIFWQFRKLREKGFIVRGSHPVGWCPSCGQPVGQHDTKGDMEPEIGEFMIIKFKLEGAEVFLPCATLRPETVFGVTNIWLNPDVEYVEAEVDGEKWIVSPQATNKLNYLGWKVRIVKLLKGAELLGKKVRNPVNKHVVPTLPARFVDPSNATGVVMSVPAHAPYDYIALRELKKDLEASVKLGLSSETLASIEPIYIIEAQGQPEAPSVRDVDKMGIKDQSDTRLENLTKEVYKAEFHRGVMKDNTGEFAGMPVALAKKAVEAKLKEAGFATSMLHLMNSPIYCRCGSEVLVKVLEDQWFIAYEDPSWKEAARECLTLMNIVPKEIKAEFEDVIEWVGRRACARKLGLGTKLPWDKEWIIESLSDSTIYMVYYVLSKYVNAGLLKAEQMNDTFFNYVLLNMGDPRIVNKETGLELSLLEEIRQEVDYFYPVDSRHSGRDLVWNHLTFFIFNHVAIFNRNKWPKQIVVNGSVTMHGRKMSKSFGNIIPLRDAIRTYGADPIRLAVLSGATLLQDSEFNPALAMDIKFKLESLISKARDVASMPSGDGEDTACERWLISRLQQYIEKVTKAVERVDFKAAIDTVMNNLMKDLEWYERRVSGELSTKARALSIGRVLKEAYRTMAKLLAPFAPYTNEEVWHILGGEGLISVSTWPEPHYSKVDLEAELSEMLIMNLMSDIRKIERILKTKPRKVFIYVAEGWKVKVFDRVMELFQGGERNISRTIKEVVKLPEAKGRETSAADVAKEVFKEALELPSEDREARLRKKVDELAVFKAASSFLSKEMDVEVQVYSAEDPQRYDPKGRAKLALPFRPGIFIET